MFDDENTPPTFRKTLKQVVKDLETIQNCPIIHFKNTIEEKFDRYSYEGEDEIIGFDTWNDITNDGEYELEVGINHEDAYTFTLFVTVKDESITVTNVL